MRLKPRPPGIGEMDGVTDENDIFGYKDFGDRLRNIFRRLEDDSIFLLDGAWGSGKSTFVNQFAGHCRQQGARVILFDAFRNDYQKEAFSALAAEIFAQISTVLEDDEQLSKTYLDRAGKAFRALTPLATDIVLKAASGGLLSRQDMEDTKKRYHEGKDALADALRERLEEAAGDRDAVENFKDCLQQAAAKLSEITVSNTNTDRNSESSKQNDKRWPVIFIIDELDRCRPDFALSVLEIVKHIFSTAGLRFLLVANAEQLERSVQHQYGTDKPSTYLEKFYDVRLTLPETDSQGVDKIKKYVIYVYRSMEIDASDGILAESCQNEISTQCRIRSVSLRTVQKILLYVSLFLWQLIVVIYALIHS